MKVLILGSGLLGVTTAYVLASRGHAVEVIERQPESGGETSYANGGQLSYSHAEPWATPGVLKKLPKWLTHADSPLVFRLRADPEMFRWGIKFLANCTQAKAERNCIDILRLGLYSRLKMQEIIAATGIAFDYVPNGVLDIFGTQAELDAAIRQMEFQAKFGCEQRLLSGQEALALEPSLAHTGRTIVGGIHSYMDACGDAQKFCLGLAAYCADRLGVKFHYNTAITQIDAENGSIYSVTSEKGEHTADAYVMALGSYSAPFLKGLGIRVPIYPMKGYSLTVAANEFAPRISVTDNSHKIVFSRLGDRLRVAGTAEFAGYDHHILESRIAPIVRTARDLFPKIDWDVRTHEWACIRPQTPDSRPLLGPAPMPNLFLNTGHGTLGWTHAAASAYIVADCMENRTPEITLGGLTLGAKMKDALYDWGGLNVWLFKLINGLSGNPAYDNLMLLFTRLGAKENFRYYFILIIFYLLCETGLRKLRGETITQQHTKIAGALVITLMMGFMVSGLAIGVTKTLFELPRPFRLPEIYAGMLHGTLHFIGPYPSPADYNASFPSGHAATIASIVTALWYKFNNRVMHYAGIALVFMVCWSRIAIGMHFPADVLAGVLIASFITYFVRRYVYRMMRVALPGQSVAPLAAAPVAPTRQR